MESCPPIFPWPDLVSGGRINRVMNEHCPNDRVVPWAQAWKVLKLPIGRSGCDGFSQTCAGVSNVHYEHVGHTKLITKLHMEESWFPFLFRGTVPPGDPRPAQANSSRSRLGL